MNEELLISSSNANRAVREALVHGIYTMTVTASSLTASEVNKVFNECVAAIKLNGAYNLSIAVKPALSPTTPKERGVVIMVYDRDRPNPYMTYGFRHQTIIARPSWRLIEQTTQLIADAMAHRTDLDDVIIHTCWGSANTRGAFKIVICRGTDTYKRIVHRRERRPSIVEPTHTTADTGAVEEPPLTEALPGFMTLMLTNHGNTVVPNRFIKRYGTKDVEKALTKLTGKKIFIRKVTVPVDGEFFIAEDEKRRRYG